MSVDRPRTSSRPRWLTRLSAALNRWNRPTFAGGLLEPLTAAEELRERARDEGRWRGTRSTPECDFCGKGVAKVERLVAGSSAAICSECLALCRAELAGEHGHGTA